MTVAINFISSKDNDEDHAIYSKSDNIETIINDNADEAVENFFNDFLYIKSVYRY